MTGCRHKEMKIASTKLEQASILAVFVGGERRGSDFARALTGRRAAFLIRAVHVTIDDHKLSTAARP